MPTRRVFPHALIVAACLLAVATAPANASGLVPTFGSPQLLSAENESAVPLSYPGLNERMSTAPDGTVTVAWVKSLGGHDVLVVRQRPAATKSWGPEQVLSPGPDENYDVFAFFLLTDDTGVSTVLWTDASLATIMTRSQLPGGQWSPAENLANGTETVMGVGVGEGPHGQVAVSWASNDQGTKSVKVRLRDTGATSWTQEPAVIPQDADESPGAQTIAFNAHGDGVVIWAAEVPGDRLLRASYYDVDADDPHWSEPVPVTSDAAGYTNMIQAAVAPNGNVGLIWANGNLRVSAATYAAGSPDWSDPHPLGASGSTLQVMPDVISDADGQFIAVWQDVWGIFEGDGITITDANASTTTFHTSAWGAESILPGAHPGGAPVLGANRDGDAVVAYTAAPDFSQRHHLPVLVSFRPSGASSWSDSTQIADSEFNGTLNVPSVAIDEGGNAMVFWAQNTPDGTPVAFAVADASGPSIDGVSVPASAQVNTSVDFSAQATDLWSTVSGNDVTWTFTLTGDQASETGSSVSHAFANPGTYSVAVSATDAAGNTTTQDAGTITVTDPPPPVVKEKTKLPPVIPARLAGKKITITTTVPNCSAKFVAVTKFGTTKYQTKLKLTKNGKVCTATGTITLKKAPSARTKLRVAIGRVTKTGTKTIATLTTKRG